MKETTPQEEVFKDVACFCACWLHLRAEIVSTRYGDIEGFVTLYPNASGRFKSVSKFLGVPFSAPPTGELRFKAPQPPKE